MIDTSHNITLPAEWAPQRGVLLTWPHQHTNWKPILSRVESVYLEIAGHIATREALFICCYDESHQQYVYNQLQQQKVNLDRVRFGIAPSNDTWARDHGPITIHNQGQACMLDFGFDGWGEKYPFALDNQITRILHHAGVFGDLPLQNIGLVLEGGSIESDGHGTLLTTRHCLFDGLRNKGRSRQQIERELKQLLGIERILCLDHGYIAGDDTDGHIDTLARFCDAHTIAYVSCDDPDDEHYAELKAMEEQLQSFVSHDLQPYRLVALPIPRPIYNQKGNRLPATHANFLIINNAVLVPIYNDPPTDGVALERLATCFPGREVIGIDCSALIHQFGSLHCITMQLPK